MITGNMVLGATGGGGGGTTNYNMLINKPIGLQQPSYSPSDDMSSDGMFMGVEYIKVSNTVYTPTEFIGGSITETGELPLTLTAANTVDFATTAQAMGYTGNVATFVSPSGNPMNGDALAFSADAPLVLINYGINITSPGLYIRKNSVELLQFPQYVEVNPNYAQNFLPTVTEANEGQQMQVGGGQWGLVSGPIKGYFDYENIVGTMYQTVLMGSSGVQMLVSTFPLGSQIRTTHKELGELVFDVVGYEGVQLDPSDPDSQTIGVKLQLLLHDLLSGFEFDATEAAVYCANGLTAGGYYIDYNSGTVLSTDGLNSDDQYIWGFTLTEDIPSGGVLVFELDTADWHIGTHVSSFASISSTTAIETVSITDITSDQTGYTDITGESGVSANYPARAIYGSGNFAQSGIYKYLSATGDNWWSPSTDFDRPPSYANRTGFLSGLDPKFLAIISNETRTFATNHYYEVGYSTDSSYALTSKFALPSYTQMGWGNNGYNTDIVEGNEFQAFSDMYPSAFTNQMRIKYLNGQPWWYWMASCSPDDPSRARVVNADGGDGDDYAANPFDGLAPVCTISAILS